MTGHGDGEFTEVTVMLEAEQVEILDEIVREYRKKLGPAWDLSAMMRVAVGDFLTKMGRIS
ncbi:MAG: hypothetical protein HY884_01945 [Deltaproteobacteria bacterium]|nr:hypothetical protein [Deltaproteobacteria bacterium]